MSATNLGRVNPDVAEAFAWLRSPAAIDAEIRRLRGAIAGGDNAPATTALLNDWERIKAAQARLVGGERAQPALDPAGATMEGA
jgi:hypothetical protein